MTAEPMGEREVESPAWEAIEGLTEIINAEIRPEWVGTLHNQAQGHIATLESALLALEDRLRESERMLAQIEHDAPPTPEEWHAVNDRAEAAEQERDRLRAYLDAILRSPRNCMRFDITPCADRPEIPEGDWCSLCTARRALSPQAEECVCAETSTRNCPVHASASEQEER